MSEKILDSNVVDEGWTVFKNASIEDEGTSMVFEFASGAVYRVPLKVLLGWYDGFRGTHNSDSDVKPDLDQQPTAIVECMLDQETQFNAVRMALDNGEIYIIAWDVVLMSCEPRYQYFGGFNRASQESTAANFEMFGPFRIG